MNSFVLFLCVCATLCAAIPVYNKDEGVVLLPADAVIVNNVRGVLERVKRETIVGNQCPKGQGKLPTGECALCELYDYELEGCIEDE